MSYADKIFIENCRDILENGTDTRGQEVRPHWPDGTSAYTIKKFGVVNRYRPAEEFPALTLRKTAIKSAMDEILWIFQKKSNNIHELNSHIWDQWADEAGSIGKAYGYQIGKDYIHHKLNKNLNDMTFEEVNKLEKELKLSYPSTRIIWDISKTKNIYVYMDQIDAVIYDLRTAPFGRRIMTSMWNFEDLHEMNLQPCCWNCTFNVTDEGKDKLVLNMVLNQRSNDTLAANNWNVVQYSLLLMMIAQVCDMIPGELVHMIADMHIYDRHVPLIKEMLEREQFEAPKVTLNPDIKDFYKFTTDDLIIENYQAGPQVKFEVAE